MSTATDHDRRDAVDAERSVPVWFVTGAGRGLGRAIVTAALERGHRVVATARSPHHLADLTPTDCACSPQT
jgi:NAD(P)-dependent dehydrogenase (short-subunit alcohol dehydrogenase family)